MIYIIEENIDRMGGVERIVSLLANYFSEQNKVEVVSVFKGSSTFFEYDKDVKKRYLSHKKFSKKINNKLKYLFLMPKIIKFCNRIKKEDKVIFGRINVAIKFIPFINKKVDVIVRDAINIYDYSFLVRIFMRIYFPKKVKCLIVSSDESLLLYKSFFGDCGIKYKKIYNPLGIDTKPIKYNFDNKIIMANGRFEFQKGFNVLLSACKIVFDKFKDWKLVLIGDGPLKSEFETYIIDNKLINNVIIKNYSKDIKSELENASIFVMTSRYEGYANSLVEAVSIGIPSITFDWLTGASEIISNNENGLIVNLNNRIDYFKGIDSEEDVINLANALIYLINNKDVAINMSKSTKKILNSRNNETIFKEWEKIIYE